MAEIYRDEQGAVLRYDGAVYRLATDFLARLFQGDTDLYCGDSVALLNDAVDNGAQIDPATIDFEQTAWLPPLADNTEIWAAGVTYFRSRVARMEESAESGGNVFYDLVYDAERPELFFKANSWAARGHLAKVRIRADSAWNVPEPELTLALNNRAEIFGFTIGNDMSSRSIEGENPLYLPQAKVYRGSCAAGPCLLLGRHSLAKDAAISIEIARAGEISFTGATDLTQIKRDLEELAGYLFRENDFPSGALLMTGTGVVPDADFTLQSGDIVRVTIEGIGSLENEVE